jgi:hypothetical protein
MTDIKFPTQEMMVRQLASDSFWKVKVMTYDVSDNLTYLACNKVQNTATSVATWYIWKYTWSAGGNCTMIEGPLVGTVDGQSSLSWRA